MQPESPLNAKVSDSGEAMHGTDGRLCRRLYTFPPNVSLYESQYSVLT